MVIATMLFGEDVVIASIDRYGATGTAIVTGRFATSTQYNRHDVISYRLLIGTVDGRVVAGEFRVDDFSVRGLGDLSIYPEVGACARLGTWTADALRQADAAPENADFRREAARAMSSERDAGCR